MRQGQVFKRCTGCGAKVDKRRCAGCGSDKFSWSFVVDVAPPGAKRKQVRRGGFRTKEQALNAMHELQGNAKDGIHVPGSKLTLTAYMSAWLDGQAGRLKASTLDSYRYCWSEYLQPRIGEFRIHQLEPAQLTAVYADLATGGGRHGTSLALRTVTYCHAILRKALNDAVRQQTLVRNVATFADLPRQQQRAAMDSPDDGVLHVWTAEQVRKFVEYLQAAGDRLWSLYVVTVGCGLRRGETLGLRWSDVDLEAGRIWIRQTLVLAAGKPRFETPKTPKSRRDITVDATVLRALREQRKAQLEQRVAWGNQWADHGLVFTRENGSPLDPNAVGKAFRKAVEDAKMPRIRFHDLRHTYATLALSAGVPVYVVSKRLGHSTLAMTVDTYGHLLPDDDEQAAETFSSHVWQADAGRS